MARERLLSVSPLGSILERLLELLDLLTSKERETPEHRCHVRIGHPDEPLVHGEGRRSRPVEPDGPLLGLAHLHAIAAHEQWPSKSMRLGASHLAD